MSHARNQRMCHVCWNGVYLRKGACSNSACSPYVFICHSCRLYLWLEFPESITKEFIKILFEMLLRQALLHSYQRLVPTTERKKHRKVDHCMSFAISYVLFIKTWEKTECFALFSAPVQKMQRKPDELEKHVQRTAARDRGH